MTADYDEERRRLRAEAGEPVDDKEVDPDLRPRIDFEKKQLQARRIAARELDEEEASERWVSVPTFLEVLEFVKRARPVEYLIGDLAPFPGRVIVTAARKSGKTTLLVNLLRCIGDGSPFLRLFGVRAGMKALYANFEMPEDMLGEWLRERGVHSGSANLLITPLLGPGQALAGEHGLDHWEESLRSAGVDVLILDPLHVALGLSSSTREGATNDNDLVRSRLDALWDMCRRAGVRAVILLDHTAKNGGTAKGAAAKEEWPDSVWRLTGGPGREPRYFEVFGRVKGIEESTLSYDEVTRELWIDAAAKGVGKPGKEKGPSVADRVWAFAVDKGDWVIVSEVIAIVGISARAGGQALRDFVKAGVMVEEVTPGSAHTRRYKVIDLFTSGPTA